jgi:opacity protein-like surface antigen
MYMKKWFMFGFVLLGVAALSGTAAFAQTDVAASLYGTFRGATNGNGVQQSPSNSPGGLFELRHISNPVVGYEATYAFNRANQVYTPACLTNTPPCGVSTAAIAGNAHEITGDWLISFKAANLRPFALAGAGLLLNEPTSGQANSTSSNTVVYVYGAGLDWGLLPHLGLRFQYRGNVYKAPDITKAFGSTGAFAHTAEPMIGVYLRL